VLRSEEGWERNCVRDISLLMEQATGKGKIVARKDDRVYL
jgi:hypothetical protein